MFTEHRQAAFTLVEISIALVIIGLIIGGILVGRDLIRSAELRGDIAQVEKVNLAVLAFKNKYGCLPGDCATASQFLSGATNGNGNDRIDMPRDSSGRPNCGESFYANTELASAVDQLARATMIENTPFDVASFAEAATVGRGIVPIRSTRDQGIVFGCGYTDSGWCFTGDLSQAIYECSYIRLGAESIGGSYVGSNGLYKPADAMFIDTKIDDGLARSGSTRNLPDYGDYGVFFASFSDAGNCTSLAAGNPYNTTDATRKDFPVCALRIKASF